MRILILKIFSDKNSAVLFMLKTVMQKTGLASGTGRPDFGDFFTLGRF
jgi:hypothetical protein